MAVPDFQTIMLPLLRYAADGKEHPIREAVEALAKEFRLSEAELNELIPSGQGRFENRVAWARSYFKQAGLMENPTRGVFRITRRGLDLLEEKPAKIDIRLLMRFPEFAQFRNASNDGESPGTTDVLANTKETIETKTPQELIDEGYRQLRFTLANDLLSKVKVCPYSFFETLVVDLLVKMGYGGNRKDAGRAVGRSGDGGIDGIIKEDVLGLDTIYLQAKRWDGTVGRPEIQKFVGALQGQ